MQLCPNHPDAYNSLGIALKAAGRFDEAVAGFSQAVELNPSAGMAHYNLASALQAQDKLDAAADSYRQAVRLQPGNSLAYSNLGLVLKELGNVEEAESCFRRALAIDPAAVNAHMNLSTVLLLRGNYGEGWEEHEWRYRLSHVPPRDFGKPRWDGGDPRGETILLFADAGIGDTLQFIRYASVLKEQGARVIFEERASIFPLLSTCAGIDELVARGRKYPPYDVVASLQAPLRFFLKTEESIPRHVPFLFADRPLIEKWGKALRDVAGFRIGINWRGREGDSDSTKRDIPLELFYSLAAIPGVSLVNLHKGAGRAELDEARRRVPIFDPGEEVDTASGAFMDTAAIIKNLDLVITSDTAIAHLAGALGAPVWVALPFLPDWRWQLDRSDSPWYPTMRLFRQKERGRWESVFEEIRGALQVSNGSTGLSSSTR